MTMQDYRELFVFSTEAAKKATDPIEKARHEGAMEAIAFIMAQTIEEREAVRKDVDESLAERPKPANVAA